MVESVFVIGATGKVGRELVRQIFEKGDSNPTFHKNPTRIVGLASSKSFVYSQDGLAQREAMAFASGTLQGSYYANAFDLLDLLRGSNRSVSLVDVTASMDMLDLHRKVIQDTTHKIVTANKNPLTTSSFEVFQQLVSEPRRYGYRCSVMAGAEAVDTLRDLRDLGEAPTEILGSFSGTLGYITSELEAGRKFSDILKNAIEMGYTEPNPAIDLSGEDVAKKILILVRTAGFNLNMQDISLNPFIPEKYFRNAELALNQANTDELDAHLAARMAEAKTKGGTLRYVARFALNAAEPEISVGLDFVSTGNPLGRLQGTSNKIVIRTGIYGDKYYSVEAPGAGISLTAMNIRRDLLYQIDSRQVTRHSNRIGS